MHVHFLKPLEPEASQLFAELADSSVRITSGDIDQESGAFQVLVAGVPEQKDLEASEQLRAVVIPWAGLPIKTRDLMLEFPAIKVYNIHHNAAPTAETAIMLMMTAARDTLNIDRRLRVDDWRPRYESDRPLLIHGRTAVVVGYGAIGRRVARSCLGLGMHVHAVRTSKAADHDGDVTLHSADQLDSLLTHADVLFLCLPRTPLTDALIGARQLAALPDDAIVVNVSRGLIIEEKALYDELRSGRLRAGLDVWYQYPQNEAARTNQPPSAFPFCELTNVVMTPHMGGHCKQIERLRAEALADLINAMLRDTPVPGRVDVNRGY